MVPPWPARNGTPVKRRWGASCRQQKNYSCGTTTPMPGEETGLRLRRWGDLGSSYSFGRIGIPEVPAQAWGCRTECLNCDGLEWHFSPEPAVNPCWKSVRRRDAGLDRILLENGGRKPIGRDAPPPQTPHPILDLGISLGGARLLICCRPRTLPATADD
jgi:hypothetical protein